MTYTYTQERDRDEVIAYLKDNWKDDITVASYIKDYPRLAADIAGCKSNKQVCEIIYDFAHDIMLDEWDKCYDEGIATFLECLEVATTDELFDRGALDLREEDTGADFYDRNGGSYNTLKDEFEDW